jgi:uncharacterized membrane protein
MSLALWIAQGILAFVFVAAGAMKLFAYEKYRAMLEKTSPTTLTHGQITFLGFAELAGAAGLIIPMSVNIAPWLCVSAAVGLGIIMVPATVFHIRRREPPVTTAVLFLLAVFVAVGRAVHHV